MEDKISNSSQQDDDLNENREKKEINNIKVIDNNNDDNDNVHNNDDNEITNEDNKKNGGLNNSDNHINPECLDSISYDNDLQEMGRDISNKVDNVETNTNNHDNKNNHENENEYETQQIIQVIDTTTTIFVGDLAYFTNENDLIHLFLPFNPVNVKIMRNAMNMKSMQYAFISFGTVDDAENAIFALNGKRFKGRHLRINFAAYKSDLADHQLIPYHRKPTFSNANSVHVKFVSSIKNKNRNSMITEELLSQIFTIFGTVYDCSIKESAFDNKNSCQYGYGKEYYLLIIIIYNLYYHYYFITLIITKDSFTFMKLVQQ